MKEPQPPILNTNSPTPLNTNPKPLRFIILGAGSRGTAYAQAVTTTTPGHIHAVAEPHAFKRREFGRNFIWGDGEPGDGQEFGDWREWVKWEAKRRNTPDAGGSGNGVDGVFICTLDDQHIDILHAITPFKDLHILCEKPLALSLSDCLSVYRSLSPSFSGRNTIFSIGHVLRYSPHNILLRKLLLLDKVIGDIVSLEHCEPVGWWHFSHSYVRGNWRRETGGGDGSLLTKSCHDVDFILWLLCSPLNAPTSTTTSGGDSSADYYHHPRTITSSGTLSQFHPRRKPPKADSATNCLSCPAERECNYSALKIYRDMHLSRGNIEWPVNVVVPDIEDVYRSSGMEGADRALLGELGRDYTTSNIPDGGGSEGERKPHYGRCVYESDNNVCDDQTVTITWDSDPEDSTRGPKTALFHMISPTEKQCERRGTVYGTTGELAYNSRTITIYTFATQTTSTIEVPRQPPEEEKSHGGGDYGLARGFVGAVEAVLHGGWSVGEAQGVFVGCTLEEAVRSHAVVFAAEEARREEKVVRWGEWWERKLASFGVATYVNESMKQ